MTYTAPVGDLMFSLEAVGGLSQLVARDLVPELDLETTRAILEEAGRFAEEKLAPLNRQGDLEGARLVDGSVRMPSGWRAVYEQWVAAGWGGLSSPKEWGGQGLPLMLSMAVGEIWQSACMAFALNPLLTQGTAEALALYGSEEIKAAYLPKLASGEWSGTMQLTEPQAGSDLRYLRTRALPQADGSYRLTGTKIFITYGDHDLADNIVHMVLARLPDAPEGTKGISLFVVPKRLPGADGAPGAPNDIRAASLEHKLGIHASPTCVMQLGEAGGAVGWLVGEPNKGLNHMFFMMNRARLGIGVQGVAIAERAWQQALAYARERRQGAGENGEDLVAIIAHPDVRRMLLSMRAKTAAARAICTMTARLLDLSARAPEAGERETALATASLLTPVAKAFGSDVGVEVASEGIQVHGGMGYIEETGAAQHYRDARIAPIYEGTNGIQALDLVTRKLPLQGGQAVRRHVGDLRAALERVRSSNEPALGQTGEVLAEAVEALEQASTWLLATLASKRPAALAGAVPYLRLFGLASGGVWLANGAVASARAGGEAAATHLALARHFAEHEAVAAPGLARVVMQGADSVLSAAALA